MIEDPNHAVSLVGSEVELRLADLLLRRLVWLQFELLGHLLDIVCFAILLVFDGLMAFTGIELYLWIISD
jgi:hypothetical protein